MIKVMVFVDGSWLYANKNRLAASSRSPEFRLDFGKLPRVLAEEIGRQIGTEEIDLVRTYLFASYPQNHAAEDEEFVQRRFDFFDMLKEQYHYEVDVFPIDYKGRRILQSDRDPDDEFEAKEKCVDIALATSMLYLAAMPYAYDVAVAVIGDRDFIPVLQHVRRLGKRVGIASIRGSCATEYADPRDEERVKDFDLIWLDENTARLDVREEPRMMVCESDSHEGDDRTFLSTHHFREGQRPYCDDCRRRYAEERSGRSLQRLSEHYSRFRLGDRSPVHMRGVVAKLLPEKGYGFITAEDQLDYYFHQKDLLSEMAIGDLAEGQEVEFDVRKIPAGGKAGAARNVDLAALPLEAESVRGGSSETGR